MPVDKTEREVSTLVDQIALGEIKLPEIQLGYVWKPTQVAKLVESLYRGYPSSSLLFWQTDNAPQTRPAAIDGATGQPAVIPLYLLDGQQRLTSLHRVLTDNPQAAIVFNIEKEIAGSMRSRGLAPGGRLRCCPTGPRQSGWRC